METRKIIQFGNSSFVVSIPKDWIRENNLKKGDLIFLDKNGNGELVLFIRDKQRTNKEIVINFTDKDSEEIKKDIISAYVNNYDVFKINGELAESQEEIKKIIYGLIGMEIIEQNSKNIIVKDVLDPKEVPVKEIMRRIDNMIRANFLDLETAIKDKTLRDKCIETIQRSDKEINKLYLLTLKILRRGLEDSKVSKILGLESKQSLDLWWLAMVLERVGDEIKELSRIVKETKLTESQIKDFNNICSILTQDYETAMSAFYKIDKKLAKDVANNRDKIPMMCDKFLEKNKNHLISRACERLKATQNSIYQIANLVIDL